METHEHIRAAVHWLLLRLCPGSHRVGVVISDTEAKVIRMRFGLDGMAEHSLQQVADSIGVTKQRVHQIEQAALKKMSSSEALYSFWQEHGGD